MANTSSRMLRLLSLLETHRYWPGAELAGRLQGFERPLRETPGSGRGAELGGRLQVSERTLRRDIDRLRELGYPVQAQRGVTGGYQLSAGAAPPPPLVWDEAG